MDEVQKVAIEKRKRGRPRKTEEEKKAVKKKNNDKAYKKIKEMKQYIGMLKALND